jgi:type VI secretion system protein ImpG
MDLDADKQGLFQRFLSELSALDDFRTEYAARYDFQGLGRDDQDVQRLIEAMAFYRARTRLTVEQGIAQYKLHALEQLFPYLLSPMPAMGLLHPILASNMTDSRVLPAQAEVVVSPPPQAEGVRARSFRTWHETPIFPLRIVEGSVRLQRKPRTQPLRMASGAGAELDQAPWTLGLDVAPSPVGAPSKRYFDDPSCSLRELCLYMNPSGDILSALRLFDALQQSCKRVTARFFADGSQRFETGCARPRVGTPVLSGSAWENPVEATRRVIHFPLAQLCVRVPLSGAPSEWTRLSIEFELDARWPSSLGVSEQSFLLNAVPVENLLRRSAEPIVSEGTELESRVQAPENTLHLRVREVLGVYASDPEASGVRQALFPRALLDEGYAVTARGCGSEREVWIETDAVLGSVGAPGKLYVDAEWYDPDARLPSAREAIVRTDAHDLGALTWRLADPLARPNDSPVMGDAALLDRLLDLQGRGPRSVRDLKMLFQVLGVDSSEVFGRIPRYIESVSAGLVPDAQSHGGSVRCYDVLLGQVPQVLVPAARLLFSRLPGVLATWTGDAAVRVSVALDASAREAPWTFDWRTTDDG